MSLLEELASFCVRDFSKEDEDKNREKKTRPMGPWGSEEGYEWSFNDDGDAIIKRVEVKSGSIVDSLTFHYVFEGEDDYAKFGGDAGADTVEVRNHIIIVKLHSVRLIVLEIHADQVKRP